MLGPGSIFLSEGRWLVRADLLLKTPACKHWGCCTLLSLVLREHLSSPPCCATVPPASWGKMSLGHSTPLCLLCPRHGCLLLHRAGIRRNARAVHSTIQPGGTGSISGPSSTYGISAPGSSERLSCGLHAAPCLLLV